MSSSSSPQSSSSTTTTTTIIIYIGRRGICHHYLLRTNNNYHQTLKPSSKKETNSQVRKHLALINHRHRLKRFSEGFFTMTNPRKSALCCLDVKHSHHTTVSEATRHSPYFSNLPNLQVEKKDDKDNQACMIHLQVSCKELDGSSETLPIIFEDIYTDRVVPRRGQTAPETSGLCCKILI